MYARRLEGKEKPHLRHVYILDEEAARLFDVLQFRFRLLRYARHQ